MSLTCPALPPSHRSPPRSPAGRWTWLQGPRGAKATPTLRVEEEDAGQQPGISTCGTRKRGAVPSTSDRLAVGQDSAQEPRPPQGALQHQPGHR